MVTDRVCGMKIDERKANHWIVYNDRRYFFCSVGCRVEFERHPEDYSVSRAQEMRGEE